MGRDYSWVTSFLFPLIHLASDTNWHGSKNSLVSLYQFMPAFSWRSSLKFSILQMTKWFSLNTSFRTFAKSQLIFIANCLLIFNSSLGHRLVEEQYSSGSPCMLPERRSGSSSLLPSNNLETAKPVEEGQLCPWSIRWTCHTDVYSWTPL